MLDAGAGGDGARSARARRSTRGPRGRHACVDADTSRSSKGPGAPQRAPSAPAARRRPHPGRWVRPAIGFELGSGSKARPCAGQARQADAAGWEELPLPGPDGLLADLRAERLQRRWFPRPGSTARSGLRLGARAGGLGVVPRLSLVDPAGDGDCHKSLTRDNRHALASVQASDPRPVLPGGLLSGSMGPRSTVDRGSVLTRRRLRRSEVELRDRRGAPHRRAIRRAPTGG